MLLQLDFSDSMPIYMQIRNQVVMGIAEGSLSAGEKLPTIRALATESGINMMTASKAYALLKQEGYIHTDRRSGAVVCGEISCRSTFSPKLKQSLKLLIAEAALAGVSRRDFLDMCAEIYTETEGAK